jgi:hypothetical protein
MSSAQLLDGANWTLPIWTLYERCLAIGIIRDDTETLKVQFSPMRGTPSWSAVIRMLGLPLLKKGGLISCSN